MATIEAAGRRERVSAGQILFSPGDLDLDLIVVASGCVEIIDAYGTPGERVIVSYGPRQFAGELNLITLEPTLLTARVAAAGEAIFVSREALRAVISHDTRLGDMIMNALVSRRAIVIEAESGARLIGHGGDPGTRELREFLTRNRVSHRFIDLDGGAKPALRTPRPSIVSTVTLGSRRKSSSNAASIAQPSVASEAAAVRIAASAHRCS